MGYDRGGGFLGVGLVSQSCRGKSMEGGLEEGIKFAYLKGTRLWCERHAPWKAVRSGGSLRVGCLQTVEIILKRSSKPALQLLSSLRK